MGMFNAEKEHVVMSARKISEQDIVVRFFGYLCRIGSENTAECYVRDTKAFMESIDYDVEAFTQATAEDYIMRDVDGKTPSPSTQNRRIAALKAFVKWANRDGDVIHDCLSKIVRSKSKRVLPECLTEEECVALLEAVNRKNPVGLRNRAILELLYSGGCRVDEVLKLTTKCIDFDNDVIKVMGKGGKERLVIMGKQAKECLLAYMEQGREKVTAGTNTSLVFTTRSGKPLTRNVVWHTMQEAAEKAGIEKHVHPHILRHSFATHLLKNGADIMVIKELLGHESIASTQIYLTVDEKDKRKAFKEFFPRK